MKQVVQSVKNGSLAVLDVPPPVLAPRGIIVRSVATVVSPGTERMAVDFASKNLLHKARSRPDLVRQVVDKAHREGLLSTIDSVRGRLEQPLALGYSSAGFVSQVGRDSGLFQVGQLVACAGGGYASHAEVEYVPRNLAVAVPAGVSPDHAAFGTIGAIALQGIRQGHVMLGHRVAVIGLGLLGQLTVQTLRAAGCSVLAVDIDAKKVSFAREMGAARACMPDEAVDEAAAFTADRGCDVVIITASSEGSRPVELAGEIARDRAPVVAVGAVDLHIPRKVYYEKELDLRLSRSYGPGRYDPEYEEKGNDYPAAYVRFTENRNIEAFLDLVQNGAVRLDPLITHRFPIEQAEDAYRIIVDGDPRNPIFGVLLTYDADKPQDPVVEVTPRAASNPRREATLRLGIVGTGNFAQNVMLPMIKTVDGIELVAVISARGLNARVASDRFGIQYATGSFDDLLADGSINCICVTTRHDLHAGQAVAALEAGKDVFVEKPLALNVEQLQSVAEAAAGGGRVMVGFNRRFAPMVTQARSFLESRSRPVVATYRVNAGAIPPGHWTQDPEVGGGRIVGEVCHFIDLLQFLLGAAPLRVYATAARAGGRAVEDEVIVSIDFADGSSAGVMYAAGGDKSFSKERIEIVGGQKIVVLDDYRRLELIQGGKRTSKSERLRPDKGHRGEWKALLDAVRSGEPSPIPFEQICAAHLAVYAAVESLRTRMPVDVDYSSLWPATGLPESPAR